MRPLINLIILLCIHGSSAHAQQAFKNKSDSLLYAKADTAFSLSFRNSDSAFSLARNVLQEAMRSGGDASIANSWNALGWAFMHKGSLDSSVICLQRAVELFSSTGSDNDVIKTCINISEVYTKQNKTGNALRYLTRADSLCIKTNNTSYHTNVFRQFGIVYRESGDYDRAAIYLKKAFDGFLSTADYFRHVNTGISLSILYRSMKLPDSSLAVLNQCLKVMERHPGTLYQVAMVEEHLAETFYMQSQYSRALQHYTSAYDIFKGLNNRADLAFESINIGKTLGKLHHNGRAEKYLLEAYHLSDTLKMTNYQHDAAVELAALYRQTENWPKAYHYLHSAGVLKDSLDMDNQLRITNELKEKFESEKKEQEIMLLKTENALSEAGNRRTRLVQYIFIILFIAAAAIGWLLFNRTRIKRKLDALVLRNQIAGDLHDDIGSVLSAIDIGSRVALAKDKDPGAMREQVVKIRQMARQTLDSMSDIVWSVNPANDNFESLLIRLKEFAAEICEPAQISLQFSVAPEVQHISINSLQRKSIFLISKEAVNNAVKYSGCATLSIALALTGKKDLLVTIQDDGQGFDETNVKKGNGLHNMRLRADNMQVRLLIDTALGKGTRIELNCTV